MTALALSPTPGWVWAGAADSPPRHLVAPEVVAVPGGEFVQGSDRTERDVAYRLDELAYGHSVTRRQRWYERERTRGHAVTSAYRITRTPITNAQYAVFVAASGHPPPDVDERSWESYGLIHPFARTRRFAWKNALPPAGREQHPVVLVGYADAQAYASWLSQVVPGRWRLPSEAEWEKAARGTHGGRFPWGDTFDAARLNSHDSGPFDTLPVGRFPAGASPYGALDMAGQVFEWTATPSDNDRAVVKGGSWDDKGCGVCRPAARHIRPRYLKHILIGFRLVHE